MTHESSTPDDWTKRTEQLIGKYKFATLKNASVLVVGLGGVGGAASEMICRAGVGKMALVDFDVIEPTNINRQLIATHSTVGKIKTNAMAVRLKEINPNVELALYTERLDESNMERILTSGRFDYVVDAIDTLSPKVFLLKYCVENGIKVVSSMGSGGKMAPELVKIDDISKSAYCPLAKAVRKRLHKFGIKSGFPVVYSTEITDKNSFVATDDRYKKNTAGTISYMPAIFGMYLSAIVIREIINKAEI